MGARSIMVHRATVQKDTATGTDAYGNPKPASWATHIASLACYYYTKTKTEIYDGDKQAVVAMQRLLVPLGTDITEKHRITAIKNRLGTSLISNPMLIRAVVKRKTHFELDLQECGSG